MPRCTLVDWVLPACQTDANCDDGLFCNGPELCIAGRCVAGDAPCGCDCVEANDSCGECCSDMDCDDGDPCTLEQCVDFACQQELMDCDDADPCTVDRCVGGDCVHDPPTCDDGLECTDDICDPATGECVFVSTCFEDEFCSEETGQCELNHECDTDADCPDDGLFCTGPAWCTGFVRKCVYPEENWECLVIGPCHEDTDWCEPWVSAPLCAGVCGFSPPDCTDPTNEPVAQFEVVIQQMIERYTDCEDLDFAAVFAGECSDTGLRFAVGIGGFTSVASFHDPDTGDFVAQRNWSDVWDSNCLGRTWWPVPVVCEHAVATAVFCGTSVSIGAAIDLSGGWPGAVP